MSSISKLVAVVGMVASHFELADALKLTIASPYVHADDPKRQISFASGKPGLPPPPADYLLSERSDSMPIGSQQGTRSQDRLLRDVSLAETGTGRVLKQLPLTLTRLQNNPSLVSNLVVNKTLLEDIIADTEGLRQMFRDFLVKEDATPDFDFLVRLIETWETDTFQNKSGADKKLEEALALINILQGSDGDDPGNPFDATAKAGASWWGSPVSKSLEQIASGNDGKSELELDVHTFSQAKETALRQLSSDNLSRFLDSSRPKCLYEALSKQDGPSPVHVDTPAKNQPRTSLNIWQGKCSLPSLPMWKATSSTGFLGRFRRASNGKGTVAALTLPSSLPIEQSGSAAIRVGEQSPTLSPAPSSTASSAPSSPLNSPRGASDGRRAPSSPLNYRTNIELSSAQIMDFYDLQRKELEQQDAAEEETRLLSLTAANDGLIAGEGPLGTPTPTNTGIRRLSSNI